MRRVKPADLRRQGLREWTTRELQALLLEQDVSLLTHLVMGVLSEAGQGPPPRPAVEGPSLEVNRCLGSRGGVASPVACVPGAIVRV